MSDQKEPINIRISDLCRVCLAFELSTMPQFRGARSTPEQRTELAARMMRRQDNSLEQAWVEGAWELAARVYAHMQPGLLALCDEAAQHALETPNYFLSTEVREKLIHRVFIDDSPRHPRPFRPPSWR